ncbi:MAG: 50S ribosomal protein L11 methyltransferase [Bacteroidales bacterium]|nr:50S ribosomal protein L11 methyltransferase [Bacteroidales bacterium]
MDYMELKCRVVPADPGYEILIAELSEMGYDSFVENEDDLLAYIAEDDFDKNAIDNMEILSLDNFEVSFERTVIEDQNWNAKWEADYNPVMIDDKVSIRAPFHDKAEVEFDIEIMPKMSFGTAHHATTAQMIQLILAKDVRDMVVLDMGSGTAVLAILACMKGAKHIDAIDNDEWAYNNAVENVERNKCSNINCELGDATLLGDRTYDFIIANINRNILLADLESYAQSLRLGCELYMSGFYEDDIPVLEKEANKWGLKYVSHMVKDEWVASKWIKA